MSISSSPPPEKNFRVLALTAVVFACLRHPVVGGVPRDPRSTRGVGANAKRLHRGLANSRPARAVVPVGAHGYLRFPRRGFARADNGVADATLPDSLLVLVVFVALGLAGAVAGLRAFPNSGDEYNYLFEAATFQAGRLWNPLPPVDYVFSFFHIAEKEGKWLSLFFPGWPLILAGVTGLHLPSFVASPALALLLLLVFARLTSLLAGPAAALLGAALMSCCPFFLFNGASYFSHVPTALFAVLFVLCGVYFLRTGTALWAFSAGAALGAVGVIRPYTVFALVIPCAVELLLRGDRRHYGRIPLVLLGGLPFLAGLLLYDNAVTGSPWLTVEAWALPQIYIGLRPINEYGTTLSLIITTRMTLRHFFELGQWTSPLLCLLYPVAWLWKWWRRRIAFYDFIFPALVMSYLIFYDFGGNQYGPRFYFDAYPFLVLTVVSAAAAWFAEQRSDLAQAGVAAALAGALIMAVGAYPALAYQFHRIVTERMEPSTWSRPPTYRMQSSLLAIPPDEPIRDGCSRRTSSATASIFRAASSTQTKFRVDFVRWLGSFPLGLFIDTASTTIAIPGSCTRYRRARTPHTIDRPLRRCHWVDAGVPRETAIGAPTALLAICCSIKRARRSALRSCLGNRNQPFSGLLFLAARAERHADESAAEQSHACRLGYRFDLHH